MLRRRNGALAGAVFVSLADTRHRLDFDQPARLSQSRDRDERRGRRFLDVEVAIAYRPQLRYAGLIDLGDEVGIQFDDIRHDAAGGFDRKLEIAENLFDLRLEIALADQLA